MKNNERIRNISINQQAVLVILLCIQSFAIIFLLHTNLKSPSSQLLLAESRGELQEISFLKIPSFYPQTMDRRLRIGFYPQYPWHTYSLPALLITYGAKIFHIPETHRIFSGGGMASLADILPLDMIIYWEDSTWPRNSTLRKEHIAQLRQNFTVVNGDLLDISKNTVDQVATQILGYSLEVDPFTYVGKCFAKGDQNSDKKANQIISCPIQPSDLKHGLVYQKYINTTQPGGYVRIYRLPLFRGTIPVVAEKEEITWPVLRGMANLRTPNEVFREEEIKQIVQFTEKFKIDYCELDILRNPEDGRMYILDVNKTPVHAWHFKTYPHAGSIMMDGWVKAMLPELYKESMNRSNWKMKPGYTYPHTTSNYWAKQGYS